METNVGGTRVLRVDAAAPDAAALQEAAAVLRSGGLVAFPTETVYGLGADATNPDAVARIYAAKGRPSDNPMIVHVAGAAELEPLVKGVPLLARTLIQRFWPGPLTLVMLRSDLVPDRVAAGLPTVAVRMPNHPVALALILAAGVPVAAPSANLSSRPSPTAAAHVLEDLAGRIDMVLDASETCLGLESTVLDISVDPPVLLRPGGITFEEICSVIGPVVKARGVHGESSDELPRAPGMKYAHYAPRAELTLVEGPLGRVQDAIRGLVLDYEAEGKRVGVLASVESRGAYSAAVVLEVGSRGNLPLVATALFGCLRAFDQHSLDVVLAEGMPEQGIGLAIMNRLRKAAAGRILQLD